MKTIIVYDANILIDFCKLGMLQSIFQLGYTMYTVDWVFGELQTEQQNAYQPYIESGQLNVGQLTENLMEEVFAVKRQRAQLSQADCAVLVYARHKSGILLTSDMNLRKMALRLQAEVHGHLWIFDQLYEQGILSGETLTAALQKLNEEVNIWLNLPKEECIKRNNIWTHPRTNP
jgi:predicted nucleic acid-binding protein